MNFADKIAASITKRKSPLTAGFDPNLESIPTAFLTEASSAATDEDYIYRVLFGYYRFILEEIEPFISSIKPNIAFYEQYGLGGLKALKDILILSQDLKIPTIVDAKRGDIGTTAEGYARAFLTGTSIRGKVVVPFDADSITVNPFLGFETIQVFLNACKDSGKGIFIMVKTSNPGSKDLQDLVCEGKTISSRIAEWISANSSSLLGSCGVSSLGAVVGATHPTDLVTLRSKMPNSLILIPGLGAQGGTSKDVIPGFISPLKGALVNVSRGLLSWDKKEMSKEDIKIELKNRCEKLVSSLAEASADHFNR